jgi:hypothetical protein
MRPVVLATLALLAVAAIVAPVAGAAPRQDPDGFTPVLASVVAPPWPVKGSDGRFHVVYEVQLLNAIPVPWRERASRSAPPPAAAGPWRRGPDRASAT